MEDNVVFFSQKKKDFLLAKLKTDFFDVFHIFRKNDYNYNHALNRSKKRWEATCGKSCLFPMNGVFYKNYRSDWTWSVSHAIF